MVDTLLNPLVIELSESTLAPSGLRQKLVWAQLILRYVVGDEGVTVTGRWDSQTSAGFRRFQEQSRILEYGRGGDWTVRTTNALEHACVEWILGERIENRLGNKNDNVTLDFGLA